MKTLPLSYLVEGKPCLVVGAGKIALRKTRHLLDAGAHVTIVAPEAAPGINALAEEGTLKLKACAFDPSDVRDMTLVMATADNPDVNRAVLEACKEASIPCNAIDSNWPDGDFITPAIYRQGDLLVTVSTGGRSCREAKQIKDVLGRILADMESGGIDPGSCESSDELYDHIIHQLQSRNPAQ